eukprot:CAMPEP_0113512232 /NCGR_PEP_ID=MMETSP0014_2-20120614/39228_1 /TAXON_ID=2857 /ORGANISM="Nitzschia sp." /LENGTH=492 /DNA_ID=CAMNT_0000408573 /DNA_START=52 /DNA_END=1530 /DNA_ORIENTATION=+ /assembly_acc=CAM_ASM_000159
MADTGDIVETVDEVNDDGDDSNKMSAEEKARAAAEARRKRIQEKANTRLATVSGEQVLGEEDKKASEEKAARIRAARARRYGKKSTTTTTTAAAPAPAPAPAAETTAPEATTETATKTTDASEESGTTDDAAPAPAPATSTGTSAGKKYQGVAKMRRKMIAQKKAQEEKEDAEAGAAAVASTTPVSSSKLGAVSVKKTVAVFPVVMHIVTVILLFVAGLDVGLQQFSDGDDGLQVHSQTALQEYGVPFVQRSPFDSLTPLVEEDSVADSKRILEEQYLSSSSSGGVSGSHDEFHEEDGTDQEKIPNIDPLFGVDLDEYTKGPGLFNQVARGAIAIHRMILWLFYFGPMAFLTRLVSIPAALWQSPPSLFITALVLRQIVGNLLLGARLPDPSEHEDAGEKNNLDVLNMAKNFVKNFFSTSFPTAVTLYEAFTHVRSDMYIAICGVFVGIAWSHLQVVTMSTLSSGTSVGSDIISDEGTMGTANIDTTSGDEL